MSGKRNKKIRDRRRKQYLASEEQEHPYLAKRFSKGNQEKLDTLIDTSVDEGEPITGADMGKSFPNAMTHSNVRHEVTLGLILKMYLRNFTTDKMAEALNLSIPTVYRLKNCMKRRMEEEFTKLSLIGYVVSAMATHRDIQSQALRMASISKYGCGEKLNCLGRASNEQMNMTKTLYMTGFFDSGKVTPAKSAHDNDSDAGALEHLLLSMSDDDDLTAFTAEENSTIDLYDLNSVDDGAYSDLSDEDLRSTSDVSVLRI